MKFPALPHLSASRIQAVFLKELVQMRRDRMTFAIMVMMPILQLVIFGYAINNDPRHMPAVVELREDGPLTRSFLATLHASSFIDIVDIVERDEDAEAALRSGEATFFISIPEGFERRLVRGERPQILVAADASDPVASGPALAAINQLAQQAFAPDLVGPLASLAPTPPPYEIVVHRRYNPEGVTSFNIVPGLLGVILTMTMVLVTSIALTRESERGTMETLLATPVRPLEVMIGKTTPYVAVGLLQAGIVLIAQLWMFHIPFTGSFPAYVIAIAVFILANLMLGYLISTIARTQMQAMQMTFFVFLPSILLSGFAFPFQAMPIWAKVIAECLPTTHFIRISRELVLKSAGLPDIVTDLWKLTLILVVLATLALLRFRRTLD